MLWAGRSGGWVVSVELSSQVVVAPAGRREPGPWAGGFGCPGGCSEVRRSAVPVGEDRERVRDPIGLVVAGLPEHRGGGQARLLAALQSSVRVATRVAHRSQATEAPEQRHGGFGLANGLPVLYGCHSMGASIRLRREYWRAGDANPRDLNVSESASQLAESVRTVRA
jgi:hypothetical protein